LIRIIIPTVVGVINFSVHLLDAEVIHKPGIGRQLHPVILMIVGELNVKIERSGRIDEDILGAECGGIRTVLVAYKIIACPHPDDGRAHEYHYEPTQESEGVDALAGCEVRVVEIFH
jgi:hypothetical protein